MGAYTPTQLYDLAEFQLRPLLSSIGGVARVQIQGGAQEEYHVTLDPLKLQALGLALQDVSNAVSAANGVQAVGHLQDRYKLLLALADSRLHDAGQIGDIVLRAGPDGVIRLKDVARISRSTVPQWVRITANGQDAVLLNIYQQPGGNTVQIARHVRELLAKTPLPPGAHLASWYDQSTLVVDSAASVRDAILIGVALAGLVLLLFLRSLKITLIAMITVPAVLAATVVLLYALGMSFNIMTLGGMAAAVGLVIDDAIVMSEHIVRRLSEARHRGEAQARHSGILHAGRVECVHRGHLPAAGLPLRRHRRFFQGAVADHGRRPGHLLFRRLAGRAAAGRQAALAQGHRARSAA